MNKHFYFAYGMNTNLKGMKQRCPNAVSLGAAELNDYKLRFAGPADIVSKSGHTTSGVLWELTDGCLKSLDVLEGYPTFYTRFIVPVHYAGTTVHAWVYQMLPGHRTAYPSNSYWDCLVEGYTEHGISKIQLLLAREYADAWEECEDHYRVRHFYDRYRHLYNDDLVFQQYGTESDVLYKDNSVFNNYR